MNLLSKLSLVTGVLLRMLFGRPSLLVALAALLIPPKNRNPVAITYIIMLCCGGLTGSKMLLTLLE